MLEELGHQFDIVDDQAEISDYRVAILPDHITLDPPLADRICCYLADGGSVLASFESGLAPDRSALVLEELGVTMLGDGNAAVRGKAAEFDTVNDVIPLHDLTVRLQVPAPVRAVTLEPAAERLLYQAADGVLTLTVPRVDGHALVCVQFAD